MKNLDPLAREREVVFCPYEVESNRFGDVYTAHQKQRGSSKSETCKKGAQPGDLYLFYFGHPESKIESFAVCAEPPDPDGKLYDGVKMWFCGMRKLYHLRRPVTKAELEDTPVVDQWWATHPYYGRPKTIRPAVADRLLRLIASREPQQVASFVHFYVRGSGNNQAAASTSSRVLSADEGTVHERLAKTRSRSDRLRKEKIRAVMKANDGRLACEVPGCGFDFSEVYGEELGSGYAHVHHKRPLAMGKGKTGLKDLAIVCANCHAMIHRFRGRPIGDLRVRKKTTSYF
jgi:HNH endonuclease